MTLTVQTDNIPGKPLKWKDRPVHQVPRKVGLLCGDPNYLHLAPWRDPSWEFWTHSSIVRILPYKPDRLYDIHPPHVFRTKLKNGFKDYYHFLKTCAIPVYMIKKYAAIPASRKFPIDEIRQQAPHVPIGSTLSFMIAHAMYEGVTTIGIFGGSYGEKSDYAWQRPNVERWIGRAEMSGIEMILPEAQPLGNEPRELYGYETHDTPEKYEEMKRIRKEFRDKALSAPAGEGQTATGPRPGTPEWDAQFAEEETPPDFIRSLLPEGA